MRRNHAGEARAKLDIAIDAHVAASPLPALAVLQSLDAREVARAAGVSDSVAYRGIVRYRDELQRLAAAEAAARPAMALTSSCLPSGTTAENITALLDEMTACGPAVVPDEIQTSARALQVSPRPAPSLGSEVAHQAGTADVQRIGRGDSLKPPRALGA